MWISAGDKVKTSQGGGVIKKAVVYKPYRSRFIIVTIDGRDVRFDSKSFDYWDIDGLQVIEDEPVYQSPREQLDDIFNNLRDDKIEKLITFLEDL